MADDWQVGDLALCVSQGPDPKDWCAGEGGPSLGSMHEVTDLWVEGGLWLSFAMWPRQGFYHAAFRKIRPLTDEERRSFVAELDCPVLQPNQEVSQALLTDGRP